MLSSSYYGGVVVNKDKIHVLDFLMIALGCAFYGYGLVNVNIANNLAEGGVTGGTDVVARIFEKQKGISMGKTLLSLDVLVLTLSLSYLNLRQMMYTLLASYVFSKIVDFIQEGSYSARGLIIISPKNDEIANELMRQLDRGISFIKAEGGYSGQDKKVIYSVISSTELTIAKRIIETIDSSAFISIIDVNEVLGEGFTYEKKPTKFPK